VGLPASRIKYAPLIKLLLPPTPPDQIANVNRYIKEFQP
jgi:hypothetical protein